MKSIFIVWFLLLSSLICYGQPNNRKGIFDIPIPIAATSKTAFRVIDGFGESSFFTEQLTNKHLRVTYMYSKPNPPNPVSITYNYHIEALSPLYYALDMRAVLPPLSLHIDTNIINISYNGDKVIMPNYWVGDTLLLDAKGTFILTQKGTRDTLLSYYVSIKNRKFLKKDAIKVGAKTYEAYTHTYHFLQKSFSKNNELLHEYEDIVEETYLEGCGLVNQKRQGQMAFWVSESRHINEETIFSELLDIR